MELASFLLVFSLVSKISSTGIQCYRCYPEQQFLGATYIQSCEHFDESSMYIVSCKNSSMCHKKVTQLDLGDGVISISYQRDCAMQTDSMDQRKINGKWHYVYDIQEAYEEGCKADATYADRVTKTVHCYCRGELCNDAHKIVTHIGTVTFVIIAYLIVK